MDDDDTFLKMSGIRESGKMFAVGDEYLSMGMSTSKFQLSDFIRCGSYAICNTLISRFKEIL